MNGDTEIRFSGAKVEILSSPKPLDCDPFYVIFHV